MNFWEFMKLLESIFTKNKCDIIPNEGNFNTFLAMRYITFFHPSLCDYMNQSINRYKTYYNFLTPNEGYNFLKNIIPKLPWHKIKYISKGSSEKMKERGLTNTKIKQIASYLEISEREVYQILTK